MSDQTAAHEIQVIRQMLAGRPRPATLVERRARLDALGTQFPVPSDVVATPVSANGVPAEWTQTPDADPSRVILYLHGGGYVTGSINSHRHMVALAGRESHARTIALDYRLAPEHRFPAALEDAVAGYRYLLAEGYDPNHIVIAGDSAGGGLAVATLLALRDARTPLPAAAWVISPWVDLAVAGGSMETKAEVDPIVQKPYVKELAEIYLGGADPLLPTASPMHADLRGLPPMLIQVGSAETLLDDSLHLAAIAAAADVRVSLQVWPQMIHVWHLFHPQLSDGRRALAEAGSFARSAVR